LWALHLSMLPCPPPEPLLYNQDYASDDGSKKPTMNSSTAEDEKSADSKGKRVYPKEPGVSTSESDGSQLEDDSEMDEMLRALSESSSSDNDKDDDTGQPRPKPEGRRRTSNTFGRNGPVSNIALLMVACWTLRLPIKYLDFIRLEGDVD
jgi:RNA polymerase I-specific transcription initiation factor RRN7